MCLLVFVCVSRAAITVESSVDCPLHDSMMNPVLPCPCASLGRHLCHCSLFYAVLLMACVWLCNRCCGAMSGNRIDAEGAQALAPSFAKLTQLQSLFLNCEWGVCLGHTTHSSNA